MRATILCLVLVALGSGGIALAQGVETEHSTLEGARVTLHLHPFLDDDEVRTLRLVGSHPQALAHFVRDRQGFTALAVSPRDGFIRNGIPAASAVALAGSPDAESARRAALTACNAGRKGGGDCVVILEVAPE